VEFPSDIKVTELLRAEKEIADRSHSLMNKASGKKHKAYMPIVFLSSIGSSEQEKNLINILKLIEPLWKTKNLELLHLRQKILLYLFKIRYFIYQKKSKRDAICFFYPNESKVLFTLIQLSINVQNINKF